MSAPSSSALSRPARWESGVALLLFAGAALWFGWAVSRGWNNGNLPGCEFRQSQTAISAYFIQRDHDFSLAYPTPVLGKPWSIPMEFPLYQWSAVALSNATGLPLIQAGRTVSVICFLLALPAVALLLRRCGLPRPQRLVAVALLLTCPLLTFYARAFLIETMALMASLWFLAAFVETIRARRLGWLLVASLAGAVAGPLKVTTFILYLIPAVAWGGWCLWHAWRGRAGSWRPVGATLGWGLGCVAVPFLATCAWTHYADTVKNLNPNGAFLVSGNLTGFNFGFGLFDLRFSARAWLDMIHFWQRGILPAPVAIAAVAVAGLWGFRWRWPALACVGLFFLAQFIFPLLYAWHEYYFVANATFLVLAACFALAGPGEYPRVPRWATALAALALLAGQAHLFVQNYYRPDLSYTSAGGTGLTQLLRHLTDPKEILVIAGEDWDSSTPFFAHRRALMIRRSLEQDWTYLQRAFGDLADESVGALLLTGEQRQNTGLLEHAVRTLGIDPRPALEHGNTTVYLHRDLIAEYATDPVRAAGYHDVVWHERLEPEQPHRSLAGAEFDVSTLHGRERLLFARMAPQPYRFFSQFGCARIPRGDDRIFAAHPLTRLWFHPPAEARGISISFGISEGAYADPANATDGIELRISALSPDGGLREFFSRTINPRDNPADRGELQCQVPVPRAGAVDLVVEVLPGPTDNASYDWAFLGDIRIQ